jgi:hypothetical protein
VFQTEKSDRGSVYTSNAGIACDAEIDFTAVTASGAAISYSIVIQIEDDLPVVMTKKITAGKNKKIKVQSAFRVIASKFSKTRLPSNV